MSESAWEALVFAIAVGSLVGLAVGVIHEAGSSRFQRGTGEAGAEEEAESETTGGEHDPVQHVSLEARFFGVRLAADGRTGPAAWRCLWARYPALRWTAVTYAVSLTLLVLAVVFVAIPA